MLRQWRSRTGWALVAAWLLLAGVLWYQAFSCTGWVCDLVALPAIFPLGFPIAWVTDWIDQLFQIPGHTPTSHIRNGYFIVPTVLANSAFYYGLGHLLGGLVNRLRRMNRS